MRQRDNSLLKNLSVLLICGVLAGVVVAAALFPLAALTGLATKSGIDAFGELPTELKVQNPPTISRLYANDGKTLIASFYDENRQEVKLEQVNKTMQHAILAAEDQRFYEHNGVDIKGIVRAFVANQNNQDTQGASTLTMQYVRLAISYSSTDPQEVVNATEQTPARKLREMRYAMALEKQLSKDDILERYLNIAPFGNRAWGIYAAAQVYFQTTPDKLTIDQAALLAGMVKAPSDYDPSTPLGYNRAVERRNYIIDNMAKLGYISESQRVGAEAIKLKVTIKPAPRNCAAVSTNNWGFFCDYFLRWWDSRPEFGANEFEREDRLNTGGFTIISTLDPRIQNAAYAAAIKRLKVTSPYAAPVAAIEPGTGKVKALAVNRIFGIDNPAHPTNLPNTDPAKQKLGIRGSYPRTTNPLITGGGDITGYQAGSSFKIFTIVAAMENGFKLDLQIPTVYEYTSIYNVEKKDSCDGKHWCPKNYDTGISGTFNMWTGLGASVNTYFVPLEELVGANKVIDAALRMGIQLRAANDARLAEISKTADPGGQWGQFTLGVSSTTPLDLANAYATLAAGGKHCEPTPVSQIKDRNGKSLDAAKPRCDQVVKPEVAAAAIDAARCPVGDQSALNRCSGTTARAAGEAISQPLAGKTGTTDGDKTATLALITRQLAVAGIMADPDQPIGTKAKMSHQVINNVVIDTMKAGMAGLPAVQFPKPLAKYTTGPKVSIPDLGTCPSLDDARAKLRNAGFTASVAKDPVDSPCPVGTVARSTPTGKTSSGSVIMIYLSNGKGGGGGSGGPSGGPPTKPPGGPGHQ
jgi:membrane peptidoglycan carboxypeptidase